MSAGAYVLVKFDNREKLLPAVEVIGKLTDISKWDAVDGHFDLVLKLKANNPSLLEKLSGLDGCTEVASCELESDNEPGTDLSPDNCYSYLFAETEKDQRKTVQKAMEKVEGVLFCSPSSGSCSLVAMVTGDSFDHIDRTINDDIRQLDGILRLKQDRIIFLDRL